MYYINPGPGVIKEWHRTESQFWTHLSARNLSASESSLDRVLDLVNNDGSRETSKVREDGLEDGTAFNTFDKLIHTIGKDIFGIRRSKNNRLNHRGNSRKDTRIRESPEVQRQLNKQFKMASEETTGIALLADNIGSELATLKRAERIRKIKRQSKKDRHQNHSDSQRS